MIYLDTSIIVPAYCVEPLSDRVDELLRRETDLAVSNLTEVEFYSALSRKVRLSVEAIHYQLAREWISQFNTVLRTLDALHLVIVSGYEMPVVTGDMGLAQSG